jgi:cell division protein FtsL
MGNTTRRKRRENTVSGLPVMVAAILIGGLPLLGRVLLKHLTIEIRKEITALEMEKNKVISEISELELQKAALSRPDRIKEIARKKLGMKEPEDGAIVIIPVPEGKNEK